jgi:HAD superfamily hydrolase (TIGR01509 family)
MPTIRATNDEKRGWLYFEIILERAGMPPSDATTEALRELHRYHQEFNLWDYMPVDVLPALRVLRTLDLQLVIVSNANGTVATLAERLGLTECVGCVLDSHVEKVGKPDPRFFEIALQRSGAHPETTIPVGDLYEVDVVGGRAGGITPVLLDPADLYPEADCARVRSLPDLMNLVRDGCTPQEITQRPARAGTHVETAENRLCHDSLSVRQLVVTRRRHAQP